MRERPILFSAPMGRALLAGTKTQTRRVVKITHRTPGLAACLEPPVGAPRPRVAAELCPYGQPGDRLWVRESFWGCDLPGYGDQPCVVYDDEWQGKEYAPAAPRPWARKFGRVPSIHMPRDCSRILLEVTDVRVERLQDISEADCIAEGIEKTAHGFWSLYGQHSTDGTYSPRSSYHALWQAINGPDSWDANPWVWAVSFKPAAASLATQTPAQTPKEDAP